MAAFNKPNFGYISYATVRPDYPPSLYSLILGYHTGDHDCLVDLGCGHGTVTRALAPEFSQAIGADPSEGMLKEAERLSSKSFVQNTTFMTGTAESLPSIQDKSVDLVVAGQAAHWFPYPEVWDELSRIVKPGGTVAFWGYADPIFPECAFASDVLHKWAYSKGELAPGREAMGRYWHFPGRARIETLYGNVDVPEDSWLDVRWVEHDGRVVYPWYLDLENVVGRVEDRGREKDVTEEDRAQVRMTKVTSVGALKGFIRTWSGYHNWREAHPELQAKEDGGTGDVVDWMLDEIAARDDAWKNAEHEIHVEWPVGMLLARKA